MDHTNPDPTPRRRGIIETAKGFVVNVLGATRNRVEDFSADVQYRTLRMLRLVVWMLVGAISLWLALCFAMLTVIFGFNLPPKYAFGIPALVFLGVGLISLLMFNRAKRSKRKDSDSAR